MLGEDLSPWLIEINSSPSMCRNTRATVKLVDMVMEDTIKGKDYWFWIIYYIRMLQSLCVCCMSQAMQHYSKELQFLYVLFTVKLTSTGYAKSSTTASTAKLQLLCTVCSSITLELHANLLQDWRNVWAMLILPTTWPKLLYISPGNKIQVF